MLVFVRFERWLIVYKNSSNDKIWNTFICKVDNSESLSGQVVGYIVQVSTVQWKRPHVRHRFLISYNVLNTLYPHTWFFASAFLYIFSNIPCLQRVSTEICKVHFMSPWYKGMHILGKLADQSNILREISIWMLKYLDWNLVQIIPT